MGGPGEITDFIYLNDHKTRQKNRYFVKFRIYTFICMAPDHVKTKIPVLGYAIKWRVFMRNATRCIQRILSVLLCDACMCLCVCFVGGPHENCMRQIFLVS